MHKKLICIFIILAIFLLGGCGADTGIERENANQKIKLSITQNFGREEILTKEIAYEPNMTVMDLLFKAELEVEAGYSGAFVDGINGLIAKGAGFSGERYDWFYFVNGIFSDVGAMDYFPQPGDVIWWDYRPWKATGASPNAVIGSFPQTFKYSYLGKSNPTIIMAFEQDLAVAQTLKKRLEELGVSQVEISDVQDEEIESPQGPTILLGQWDLLQDIEYVKKLNKNHKRAGFYGFFNESGLNLLDRNLATVKAVKENAGLIISTGQGSGDPNSLWIVTGIDEEGFTQAVQVLVNENEKLEHLYNAAIINGEVVGLPLEKD